MRGNQALALISFAPVCSAFGFPGYPAPPPALPPSIYDISYPFTFSTGITNNNQNKDGPTLSTIRGLYSSAAWAQDNNYLAQGSFQGYQLWTVPQTGTYTITAKGAQGGAQHNAIGYGAPGARVSATFDLTMNEKIEIIIGHGGGAASADPHGNSAGGGGGTFVLKYPRSAVTESDILLIAGGGGGSPSINHASSCPGYSNRAVGEGQDKTTPDAIYCTASKTTAASPGGYGGYTAGNNHGAAGGGFRSAGANGGTHCATATGGGSVQTGLVGGTGDSCYTDRNRGGFGGGGGGNLGGPGAGGGYSGGSVYGSWSTYAMYGGGGSSYSNGAGTMMTKGGGEWYQQKGLTGANGEVVVELVSPTP